MRAFGQLCPSRQLRDGSVGHIPISEIESYCRLAGVADRMEFLELVQHLDRIYVAVTNERLERERKNNRN